MRPALSFWRQLITAVSLGLLAGCAAHVQPLSTDASLSASVPLAMARAHSAERAGRRDMAARGWLECAALAYRQADGGDRFTRRRARASLCTGHLLEHLLARHPSGWAAMKVDVAGISLSVELRDVSPDLQGPLQLRLATEVRVPASAGPHFVTPGFGVSLVARTDRCSDRPRCRLLPAEGVFRALTAWVQSRMGEAPPTCAGGSATPAGNRPGRAKPSGEPRPLGALRAVDRGRTMRLACRSTVDDAGEIGSRGLCQ